MKELLKRFEEKNPEVVFEWHDPETEAKGWVVINSLRGGAAGGGTRMRPGLDKREVESLAKTMEIKFTVSGPAIGGAKSGIDFDPADPRKQGVLERWYKAVLPLLKNYYGTGGDLNIDEVHEVIPITSKLGLLHPQEGVVTGHFGANEADKQHQIDQLQTGVSKAIADERYTPKPGKYLVADMITGYGVAQSVLQYYQLHNIDPKGKTAIVQGWGNVGSAAAWYLAQNGVKIVGIIDRNGGLIKPEGLSSEEVTDLFLNKKGNTLSAPGLLSFEEVNEKIWDQKCDIFLPCAASRLLTRTQIDSLAEAGMELMACGANVPFADKEIFFGPIMEYADQHLTIIPDFVANCGMARVFAYCMQKGADISDEAIFADTASTIKEALQKIISKNDTGKNIAQTGFEIALAQLI